MLVVDDYFEGKIYIAQDIYDLMNVLPEDLGRIIKRIANTFPKGREPWEYIGQSGTRLDLYYGSIQEEQVLGYLSARDCLNSIIAV